MIAHMPKAEAIERVLIGGDIGQLNPEMRLQYYNQMCDSLGLNPLTKPFQYLTLSGKTVLYATKDCTEQLRNIHGVSLEIAAREVVEGCYVVTARAKNAAGRTDESIGAVPIDNLKGEQRSNAMMKAETKAKRRVTLSICGLGMLDESEVDSIPGAQRNEGLEAQKAYLQSKAKEIADTAVADPDYAQRHAKLIEEANEILTQPTATAPAARKRGTVSFDGLKKIKEIKDDLRKISGTDNAYYEILQQFGVSHADELDLKASREVYKALAAKRGDLVQIAELRALLHESLNRLGEKQCMAILGSNGCEGVEQIFALNGTQLNGLLEDLKRAVDAQ